MERRLLQRRGGVLARHTLPEALGIDAVVNRVKIYGTDVDEEALRGARSGLYSAKALEALPAELRERYFEQNGAKYSFRSDLRRRVIFGRHDITRDAPISRLDLLVCRNTLMYFNVEAQTQIVDRFHFALREGGYLFLGKAEMLLNDGERFDVVNVRQRIFRRRPGRADAPHQPSLLQPRAGLGPEVRTIARARQLRDLILDATPTPAVSVDTDGTVVLINNSARTQFGLTANDVGRPFPDLEISYRPVELRSLIEQATHERRTLRVNGTERRVGDDIRYYDILVHPLTAGDGIAVATSITFVDVTLNTELNAEIKRVREDLETAYEELQAGNEELETMNEELGIRTRELDEARSFLEGVVESIAAGVVVVDTQMQVKCWNKGAVDLWGLRADEALGEDFFGLDFGLPVDDLRALVQECVDSGRRVGPVTVPSVNRLGRAISCTVVCSVFDGRSGGVVLLMEEQPTADGQS